MHFYLHIESSSAEPTHTLDMTVIVPYPLNFVYFGFQIFGFIDVEKLGSITFRQVFMINIILEFSQRKERVMFPFLYHL